MKLVFPTQLLCGVRYKIVAFHKWEEIKPVSDSACATGLFNRLTNCDAPRTEKRITHDQIGNVPTK